VKLFISKGNFKKVPDLSGATEDQARFLLSRAGFTADPKVDHVYTNDPTKVGLVQSQDPAVDTDADPSRPVRIIIALAFPATPTATSASPSASG
jgi:beta-lactam-binding protein with PASTA domain